MPTFELRPARPTDREAVYFICLQTADAGADATALYVDGDLPGHLHAGAYLTLEPDLAWVLADHESVCGYVVGTADTPTFRRRLLERWLPPLQRRYPPPTGDPTRWSPDERLRQRIHAYPETPAWVTSGFPAHLHINLLPRAQGAGQGRRMMGHLLTRLREAGAKGVHLGVLERNARAVGFYHGLGFRELARVGVGRDAAIYMGREP